MPILHEVFSEKFQQLQLLNHGNQVIQKMNTRLYWFVDVNIQSISFSAFENENQILQMIRSLLFSLLSKFAGDNELF